jgi:hypothetical protein
MLTVTDLVFIGILIFSIWDGWRAGFIRCLLNPIFLFFFIPIGLINFDLNRNIAVSLLITLAGGFGLATLCRLVIFFFRRNIQRDFKNYVFLGSRILGGITSSIWKTCLFMAAVLLLSLLPANLMPGIIDLQKDLMSSRSYSYIQQNVLTRFPRVHNIYLTLSVFKDPTQNEELSQMPEFEAFYKNPKVQELIEDDGIKAFLAGRHFLPLLTHPKLIAVMTDDALMARLSLLSRRIYEEKFNAAGNNGP